MPSPQLVPATALRPITADYRQEKRHLLLPPAANLNTLIIHESQAKPPAARSPPSLPPPPPPPPASSCLLLPPLLQFQQGLYFSASIYSIWKPWHASRRVPLRAAPPPALGGGGLHSEQHSKPAFFL